MESLLKLEQLSKHFTLKGSRTIWALKEINLEIYKGETLGIVGESGCGKSTLARTIMGVYPDFEGRLLYHGKPLHLKTRKDRLIFAEKAQMIFQDPYSSLNPRMNVGDIIAENFQIHKKGTKKEQRSETEALLESVGLPASCLNRFPNEFSGGQRQRIGIARALALNPELLICDEPISALDVSIQSQIMNLLIDLKKMRGLTYLFIAHDLSMVFYLSDRIAVMYGGRIVELAQASEIDQNALHPYTQALSRAILSTDPAKEKDAAAEKNAAEEKDTEEGKRPIAQMVSDNKGCVYAKLCQAAEPVCMCREPELREVARGHFAACHKAGRQD